MKPANILIGPDNRAVLTDFGIAWAADGPAVTTAGLLIGSPSYIAPERARGGRSGAQVDLWGLGASLYTAVEGHPPFERANALASITAVVSDGWRRPPTRARCGQCSAACSARTRTGASARPRPSGCSAASARRPLTWLAQPLRALADLRVRWRQRSDRRRWRCSRRAAPPWG